MDTIGLIRLSQWGDMQAREQLITENVGLVWSMVRRFLGRGCDAEDLFQIGVIGLIKAIDKFDVTFDVKFSTYAVPMISGEMKRFLRDDGMIKVSRTLKENNMKLRASGERLAISLGRDATLEEIAQDTGMSMEEIVLAMEACTEVESLSKPINRSDGSEGTLAERIPGETDATETIVNHMVMKQLLSELQEEERRLIELRYFQNKTQTEIAGLFGVSQVQISRMEKKILKRMRALLA
ncbi:MAG: SigB/SigF/SigG family RNA polymerase sigma factor [Lachnospiraceae bacterium]|nr:SigB/SigF/SigG family RNA polymerase sigma factor [Lachnospiraceae bacterium]